MFLNRFFFLFLFFIFFIFFNYHPTNQIPGLGSAAAAAGCLLTPLLRSRHAVLHDRETGETYQPLRHIDPAQAPVFVHNSSLSEYAVLGYELGFSLVLSRQMAWRLLVLCH
jgi:hypothetical protein